MEKYPLYIDFCNGRLYICKVGIYLGRAYLDLLPYL